MIVGYKYSNEGNDIPADLLDCSGYFREVLGETHTVTADRLGLPDIGFMNFRVFDRYEIEILLEVADEIRSLTK